MLVAQLRTKILHGRNEARFFFRDGTETRFHLFELVGDIGVFRLQFFQRRSRVGKQFLRLSDLRIGVGQVTLELSTLLLSGSLLEQKKKCAKQNNELKKTNLRARQVLDVTAQGERLRRELLLLRFESRNEGEKKNSIRL